MKSLYYIFSALIVVSCGVDPSEDQTTGNEFDFSAFNVERIGGDGELIDCPRLSLDQNGNPVLSWVSGKGDEATLNYSLWNNEAAFKNVVEVTSSKGLSPHHENMPKVAFKNNGVVVSVFQKKLPTEENKYAGALYYSISIDEGSSWSKPKFLHSDTSAGIGRSYVDVALLKDGEVGAVWLDGRRKSRKGSTLFFAKTNENGFRMDTAISETVCQCCRTDIHVDEKGLVNVAYRDIFDDTIRDMAYLNSSDAGTSFSSPKKISDDSWVIDGCPHTGPSIADNSQGLHFAWFTLGGDPGIYYASSTDEGSSFSKRALVSPEGSHPQIVGFDADKVAIVYEEAVEVNENGIVHFLNQVKLQLRDSQDVLSDMTISEAGINSTYPVVLSGEDGIYVAWSERVGDFNNVAYTKIELEALK